jgi:drug/metabolite transporter (DMT)-like permease
MAESDSPANPPNRKPLPLGLFAALIALDTIVFSMDKVAANHATTAGGSFYYRIVSQPWIWIGLAVRPAQLFTWTRILQTVDLSLAFPLAATSYISTMLVSVLILHEHLGPLVWVGAVLIVAGVAVLGQQGHGNANSALPPSGL